MKNPDFLKEVASACSKEDHIVVVSYTLSALIGFLLVFAAKLYLMIYCFDIIFNRVVKVGLDLYMQLLIFKIL